MELGEGDKMEPRRCYLCKRQSVGFLHLWSI